MLDNQKKSLYKGLSMLLAIILLIHWTAPAGITQGYSLVDEIPEARESLDDQGLGPLGEFESGEELDTNPLQEELPLISEDTSTEPIEDEADGSEQTTKPPVWPEDRTITLKYSTQTEISISWPEAIIETSDDLNYVISVCQSVYQSEQYIVENFLVGPITEYTVEDLLPGVEYRFDIEAVDERGQYSEILSGIFSTLPLDDEPPSEELPVSTDNISDESIGDESDGSEQNTNQAPVWPEDSTINLKYRTQRVISITWTEAQVEGSDVVDYFVSVYQGDKCIADEFFVGTIPEYIAYNLSPGLEYRFDIQAYYVGQFSEVLSGTFSTSPLEGNEPPFWPEGSSLGEGIITSDTAEIYWSPALDDKGVAGYMIYQDGELIGEVPGSSYMYEVIGLLPLTTYTFKVEAVDEEGLFTTDGPEITITTKRGKGLGLRANTQRTNINGHLFMGDTIKIEYVSINTGLSPKVIVVYKEWNDERTAILEKPEDIVLEETLPGSKKYHGDFVLREGICEIVSIEGDSLKEAPDKIELDLKVAGRLKVEIQKPDDESELKIFNDYMNGSTVSVYRVSGGGGGSKKLNEGVSTFLVEGLSEGEDYIINQRTNDNIIRLYHTPENEFIEIQAGLETNVSYKLDIPANVRVKVVDEDGEPIPGVMVTSTVQFHNGNKWTVSLVTGKNGYAVGSDGYYFAKNVNRGSSIDLTFSHRPESKDIYDMYAGGTQKAEIKSFGDNEIVIELKKVEIVTLQGRVTDTEGNPMRNVHVRTSLPTGSIYCNTDKEGKYSLELPKIDGSIEVSFYHYNHGTKYESLILTSDTNTLNITMPVAKIAKVYLDLRLLDNSGGITKIGLYSTIINRLNIKVRNKSNDKYGSLDIYTGLYNIEGQPGDIIEITADGELDGYSKGSVEVVLNKHNNAEAILELKEYSRIRVYVTDEHGDNRPGSPRYMYIYKSEDGTYVGSGVSYNSPNIESHYILPGNYRAVISWDSKYKQHISGWENAPRAIITESFTLEEGKDFNLGIQTPPYTGAGFTYFKHNKGSGITSSHKTALPGTVITLRVTYDYERIDKINWDKLDLVADIPIGTELVKDSVIHKVRRGDNDLVPVIKNDRIRVDLKDHLDSAAGTLIYQVRVGDQKDINKVRASAALMFNAAGALQSERIGIVSINTKLITMSAPLEIAKNDVDKPIKLSGQAPAGNLVELYDGDIKIGEAITGPSGLWSADVILPDRGTPIFHTLTAKTKVGNPAVEHSTSLMLLVGTEGAVITEIELTHGTRSVKLDPRQGVVSFPFVVADGMDDFIVSVAFDDPSKVKNVSISGYAATREGDLFVARMPANTQDIIVEYDEKVFTAEDILKYDHGQAPSFMAGAEVRFTDETKSEADVNYEFGQDGYLNSLDIPEVKIDMLDNMGSVSFSMKVEAADFDPANAENRMDFGDNMYGYDFQSEVKGDKVVITAYLDRRILEKTDYVHAGYMTLASANPDFRSMMNLAAAPKGLNYLKTSIDIYSAGNKVVGAFGDLEKSTKLQRLLSKYDSVLPNLEPHLIEYYDSQIQMMSKDILVGKGLGLVGDLVGEAANLVPVLGQVVTGIAGAIADKLLGDMFDNEFELDYNRLMNLLSSEPGGQEPEYIEEWVDQTEDPLLYYDYENNEWRVQIFVEKGYMKRRNIGGGGNGGGGGGGFQGNYQRRISTPIDPKFIYDPSGYVYETVEDNRIEGVTATVLCLPKEKAADASEAKASTEWEFWDAEWYLQVNPQITDSEGRYAWDVPEGWWMVQFVKEGYETAYSNALPVPPPQLDVNVPMVKLEPPKVEETLWGSGGRYVDIYFSKYMDVSVLTLPNAISIDGVSGEVTFPVGIKTGVKDMEALNNEEKLQLTKVVRFVPISPLEEGEEYKLTVNGAVTDYAGFSIGEDYTDTQIVPASALIESLSGRDIEVEPGKDITQLVEGAVSFIPDDPAMEGHLDKRLKFTSSHDDIVQIWDNTPDVKIVSKAEGTAKILATSLDDPSKSVEFNVRVKYPPVPIAVTGINILDANGNVLTSLELYPGDTYTLKPNLLPANTTQRNVEYWSDNEEVVTVTPSGVIKAVSKGIGIITVMAENSSIKQQIHIRVLEAPEKGSGGNTGGSGYSGGPSTSTIRVGKGMVEVNYTMSKGLVTLLMSNTKVNEIIEKTDNDEIVFDFSKAKGVTAVTLSKDALTAFSKAGSTTIKLPIGSVTIKADVAASIVKEASGSNLTFELKHVDMESLKAVQKEALKSSDLVIDINITSAGKKINTFDGTLKVQVNYTGQGPVAVWYWNEKGEVLKLDSALEKGLVSFEPDHPSIYVVGQDTRKPAWVNPFTDVKETDWFYSAVSFCAEKGITKGTSARTFSPNEALTRGQFITMLLRAYGIEPDEEAADNFIDAGNTYYTGYLGVAKRLKISKGVGDNRFAPDKLITRQEMFTLLYNTLKMLDKLPTTDNGKTLADFTDNDGIEAWAIEAMAALVKSGTVTGFNNKLDPKGNSTRAEMAQVLYNLLGK